MRLAAPLLVLMLLALPLGGCGGAADEGTDHVEATFHEPVPTRAQWEHTPDCQRPAGASRWGCSVGAYRCQGVVTDRGWSISCAKPGRSVAFTVRP